MLNSDLVSVLCPLCGELLVASKLTFHLDDRHESVAEDDQIRQMLAIQAERLARLDTLELATCELCGCSIKRKNLERHRKKVHSNPLVPHHAEPRLGDLPKGERKRALSELFGPDIGVRDEWKRKRVEVQGGGFGVGGTRK